MSKKKQPHLFYFLKSIANVIGVVLIWRGCWYALDKLDLWFFGGSHIWTALGGVLAGLIILYSLNKDLRSIEEM